MIILENISKSYSGQELFNSVSFKINRKERVGLIGNNGHGKTTLFRLIIKEETPDAGKIIVPKNYRIGHVKQEVKITAKTVLLEAALGLRENDPRYFWKAEKILFGLGFSSQDMQINPANLSGGFQVRLNLARVLVSEPDMLLLDEPNNYLDITSIRWLSRFLSAWPGELILITHDRSFMDRVVTHTIGIHRKKLSKLAGNTEKFYMQIAKEEEIYEKTRINEARKKKEIELFISRFRSKARLAGMVQSRIKTISKMKEHEKLDQLKTLDFSFSNRPLGGKYVMSVKNVSFSYRSHHTLIKNFNLTVGARDKICVIGQNGKGKTTLLKILSGNQKPDEGEVVYHPLTATGYYEQSNIKHLQDSRTVFEEIMIEDKDVTQQKARNICGTMMFE
ncbi:MAG: ABC-F family ATP-binding cassette domain-containing protein, partial [Desulfobacterales bacterium]